MVFLFLMCDNNQIFKLLLIPINFLANEKISNTSYIIKNDLLYILNISSNILSQLWCPNQRINLHINTYK